MANKGMSYALMIVVSTIICMVMPSKKNEVVQESDQSEKLVPRIINGRNVKDGEFPWNMALIEDDEVQCAAALITGKTALTAAHCIYRVDPENIRGRIGNVDYLKGKEIQFLQLIPHENFDKTTTVNDIGLLILQEEIDLSQGIKTIALPPKDRFYEGKAQVAGWGFEPSDPPHSPYLMQSMEVSIMPRERCQGLFANPVTKHTIICALLDKQRTSKGDSGASLLQRVGDRYISTGVMSTAFTKKKLELYTSTSPYADWIKNNSVGVPTFID